MKKFEVLLILVMTCIVQACNPDPLTPEKDIFPAVKSLDSVPETTFVTCLEEEFSATENGIYSATLMMAWGEVKSKLDPISKIQSPLLKLMNKSNSYQNVLDKNESRTSILVEDFSVKASAYLRVSLPFKAALDDHDVPLWFLTDSVQTFGFNGDNEQAEILYYKSDEDFSILLKTELDTHDIILMTRPYKKNISFKDELTYWNKQVSKFQKKRKPKTEWQHTFNDEDEVKIPKMAFNIETNYQAIEGTTLKVKNIDSLYRVVTAYQRTAFLLNENGAEIESEALFDAATEAMNEELPRPKYLVFDQPFIVILKRSDRDNPFFVSYVANSQLLEKANE